MKTNLIENRHIRVFISSTFQDMQEERDYLMKKTFPKLRRIALKRNVTLTEVDLRWGITKEESESGKVVEICLREIENSNPFFIGLIGKRYGWIPKRDEINDKIFEILTPIERYMKSELSVTEMEIQYGVLEREITPYAYFFIKRDDDSESDPIKLKNLKEKVQKSAYPSYLYSSVEQLGEEVEKCFTQLLDILYPIGDISENEHQVLIQTSLLNQLCLSFQNRNNYLQYLDEWLEKKGHNQLLISGVQGIGKSSLVANWVNKLIKESEWKVVYLFINKLEKNPDRKNIEYYLGREISKYLDLEIVKSEDILIQLFKQIELRKDIRLLLVIDGLNHINNDKDKLLNWIPDTPDNIKIVYTSLNNDSTFKILKRKEIPILILEPLSKKDITRVSKEYLHLYGKSLTNSQLEVIADNELFSNPIILKSLLNELVKFGSFDNLNSRLQYLASIKDSDLFYEQILQYAEDDFGVDFVSQVLSIIALSRRGLFENDILEIINKFSDINYTPLAWSQLYSGFIDQFNSAAGIINFENKFLLKAVTQRYLNNEWKELMSSYLWAYSNEMLQQENGSDIILSYFLEGIFQAINLNDREAAEILHQQIGNAPSLALLFKNDEALTIKCLNLLKKYEFNIEIYFYDELISKNKSVNIEMTLSLIYLAELLDYKEVLKYLTLQLKSFLNESKPSSNREKAEMFCEIANRLSQGSDKDFKKAFEFYNKAIELLKGERCHTLSIAYNGLSLLIIETNQVIDIAEQLSIKALEINKELFGDFHLEVAVNYDTLARINEKKRNFKEAENYYNKSIELIKTIKGSTSPYLLVPLYNLSLMLYEIEEYSNVKRKIEEAMEIIRIELNGDYDGLNDFIEIYKKVENL